jgi:hypothetical protein
MKQILANGKYLKTGAKIGKYGKREILQDGNIDEIFSNKGKNIGSCEDGKYWMGNIE